MLAVSQERRPSLPSSQPISDPNGILSTQRLRLRPFHEDDSSAIRLLAGDREVSRMTRTIPHPYPEGAARLWLEHTNELIERKLLRQHAIIRSNDDLLIGCLTLRKRSAEEEQAELSYWLGKSFWGCGYIPEAAHAALSDATVTFGLTSARAAVLRENLRSTRVLEKLGFVLSDIMEAQGPGWEGKVELSRYVLNLGAYRA